MSNWMVGAGTLIGGLGQAYGAYYSAKAQEKANDLKEKQYTLDKQVAQRNIDKENKAQFALDNAMSSVYNTKKKEKAQFTLGAV
jgi:hypothetical protein